MLSLAPSLLRCYIFESHFMRPLRDWNREYEGFTVELDKRWFKEDWTGDPQWITDKILVKIRKQIEAHIKQVEIDFLE